jgi:hypothetical protein
MSVQKKGHHIRDVADSTLCRGYDTTMIGVRQIVILLMRGLPLCLSNLGLRNLTPQIHDCAGLIFFLLGPRDGPVMILSVPFPSSFLQSKLY